MFCHVSTSYCHLGERFLEEKPYPPPADPHKIINTVENLEEDVVQSMTKQYVAGVVLILINQIDAEYIQITSIKNSLYVGYLAIIQIHMPSQKHYPKDSLWS